jgi:hypothetical protein
MCHVDSPACPGLIDLIEEVGQKRHPPVRVGYRYVGRRSCDLHCKAVGALECLVGGHLFGGDSARALGYQIRWLGRRIRLNADLRCIEVTDEDSTRGGFLVGYHLSECISIIVVLPWVMTSPRGNDVMTVTS